MPKIEVEKEVEQLIRVTSIAMPSEKESDNEYDNIMQAYFDEKDDSKYLPNVS